MNSNNNNNNNNNERYSNDLRRHKFKSYDEYRQDESPLIGVSVISSSVEYIAAILNILKEINIPAANCAIGTVKRKHVMITSSMLRKDPKYSILLAFDVPIDNSAIIASNEFNVLIISSNTTSSSTSNNNNNNSNNTPPTTPTTTTTTTTDDTTTITTTPTTPTTNEEDTTTPTTTTTTITKPPPIFDINLIEQFKEKLSKYFTKDGSGGDSLIKDEKIRIDSSIMTGKNYVWPCILEVRRVIRNSKPIVVNVLVKEGTLYIGTPICVQTELNGNGNGNNNTSIVDIGTVSSVQLFGKNIRLGKKDDIVSIAIDDSNTKTTLFRQFDDRKQWMSKVTKESIDALNNTFEKDLIKQEINLLDTLKNIFKIQ